MATALMCRRTLKTIARQHQDNPKVLAGVMFALGNLTFQVGHLAELTQRFGITPYAKVALTCSGFLPMILDAMEAHPADPTLLEASMWVLANLFFSDHDDGVSIEVWRLVIRM